MKNVKDREEQPQAPAEGLPPLHERDTASKRTGAEVAYRSAEAKRQASTVTAKVTAPGSGWRIAGKRSRPAGDVVQLPAATALHQAAAGVVQLDAVERKKAEAWVADVQRRRAGEE